MPSASPTRERPACRRRASPGPPEVMTEAEPVTGPCTALGGFGWFLAVWVVMMAAMMFPSVSPTVALYARMSRSRVLPVAFTAGYVATWAAAGAVAFVLALAAGHAAHGT